MKLGVVGSRSFKDYKILVEILGRINDKFSISEIISGGAKGAELLGKRYAEESEIVYTEFLPEWDKYGKSAGFKRNRLIVKESDFLVAFWDGKSLGTKSSINLAKKKKIPIVIYDFKKGKTCFVNANI